MSDARLREVERAFAATGSLDNEAAVLRERLRVGLITPKAMDIAYYCLGYPAAFLVLGGENDTWEYWRPDRLPDEIDGMTVDIGGKRLPLAALMARPFAMEMANLLGEAQSDRLPERRIRPYINLAKSLGRKRQLAPTDQQRAETMECIQLLDDPPAADGVYEVPLMFAIIVLASDMERAPRVHLQLIFRLFLRANTIVGHVYSTRHYWARRAILHAVIPHLLGHASTLEHCEHLWQAKRKIPPRHRTPERS